MYAIKNNNYFRQQNIIKIIKKWNFDDNFPTIEDLCVGKINRLTIARTFNDLLGKCFAFVNFKGKRHYFLFLIVLSKMKYVILTNYPESLELQYIEKGEKLK